MTTADSVPEVIRRELSLLNSAVRSDRSEVDALLDPDYREIGASGRLWTREAIMAALSAEASEEAAPIEADQMIGQVIAEDIIVLTYVTDRAGRRARRSSLWRRTEGNWRLVFHQGTLSDL